MSSATVQTRLVPTRVAYSALSAGIGMLWLTHEQGIFRKHGLDSNLVYIRSSTTAVQAFLAGEIQLDPRKETELNIAGQESLHGRRSEEHKHELHSQHYIV